MQNSQSGYVNLFIAENCMKIKEFGSRGVPGAPLDPPMIIFSYVFLSMFMSTCGDFMCAFYIELELW